MHQLHASHPVCVDYLGEDYDENVSYRANHEGEAMKQEPDTKREDTSTFTAAPGASLPPPPESSDSDDSSSSGSSSSTSSSSDSDSSDEEEEEEDYIAKLLKH